MHSFRQRLCAHLRFRGAAYLVLMVALAPAFVLHWRVGKNVRGHDEARFAALANHTQAEIQDSLQMFFSDLRAFSGLFEASTNVTDREWNTFIETLGYERRHPGVRSVGYAAKVTPDQLAQFTTSMRSLGDPGFRVFPTSTNAIMLPVIHVRHFPIDFDRRLGWDSYSEPARRLAIDSVMRTKTPAVTGKIPYWVGNSPVGDGFTVFVPVFAGKENVSAVIFSSFIPQYLFNTLSNRQFDGAVSVEMFDGKAPEQSSLLASSGVPGHRTAASFSETVPLRVLDRTFLLRIATLPAFDAASEQYLPKLVLSGGLIFSFLLFGITWRQASSRSIAEKINLRLRDSEECLRAANAELERKIAEAKVTEGLLAYERDLLRTFLDQSPDAVYFKDRDSRFIKCGRAVHGHLGLGADLDAVGKTDFDFFTEEHARPAFDTEQEIIRTGVPAIGLVEKETWRDGRETWVLTSKMPLRDNEGKIIGTFGISKDITKFKMTELALQEEKNLLAVTLRSIGDGVITTDIQGRVVLFNQVAEKLTGWTQAEATGRPLSEVFCLRDSAGLEESAGRASNQPAAQSAREKMLVARDGSVRNISKGRAPIIDVDGNEIGDVLVFRDITENLKTEAELLKASKLESIGVLAGGIAHDFNNILTVILGNISLARLAESTGKPITESLVEAEHASLRARELTHRLLTFAKGGAPIKKPLDLSQLVRGCTARALQGIEITPEFFIGDGLWTVEADESQISQVVQNLITHARSSMSHDPRLDIHVLNQQVVSDPLLLLKSGDYVRISIRDYGAGIQPENLTKIFEPYFGPKRHGNGLELATAYSIVRKHEGQIRVESIAGQGTVFHIYLPATAAAASALRTLQPASTGAKTPRRNVLVMDDELAIRKLTVLLLHRIGYTAVTAADGVEAIQVYEAARQRGEPFAAVIMDLTVPNGLGGKETIRRLKALDPHVLAIVSSGYSNDPVMANFRDFGFSGVVPKPYTSDDLAAALNELLGGQDELQTGADAGDPRPATNLKSTVRQA